MYFERRWQFDFGVSILVTTRKKLGRVSFRQDFWDRYWRRGALSIQPKFLEISAGRSNGTHHFGLVRPEYSGFEGGPLWPVWSFWLVKPTCPFPFDKTALLYPTYKNNNQTRGGLDRVCATGKYLSTGHGLERVEFPKFQSVIFVKWKAPAAFSYWRRCWPICLPWIQ